MTWHGIDANARARVELALQSRTAPQRRSRIVMLTAYDAISASIAADAGVDIILVGDSAATTVLGYATTREIHVDEMLMLTRAARRGAPDTAMIGDLPFGSYESSDADAVVAAQQFVDAGADLVKLEGAREMATRVSAIADHGIPVVGHVGLLPQAARSADELKARGRSAQDAEQIVRDAVELEQCGASLIVIEAVPAVVADEIARRVSVPTIGIGAGGGLGGQVLVYPDVLGLSAGKVPRFVRQYAQMRTAWTEAIRAYAADVRSGAFPGAAEEYGMPDAERTAFEKGIA